MFKYSLISLCIITCGMLNASNQKNSQTSLQTIEARLTRLQNVAQEIHAEVGHLVDVSNQQWIRAFLTAALSNKKPANHRRRPAPRKLVSTLDIKNLTIGDL